MIRKLFASLHFHPQWCARQSLWASIVTVWFSIVNWNAFPIFPINWYYKMFDGGTFPRSLDEELFNSWLEKGRTSNMGYKFLLVIWDEYESNFRAAYTENREAISEYDRYPSSVGRESLVAAYDLYSESRIV